MREPCDYTTDPKLPSEGGKDLLQAGHDGTPTLFCLLVNHGL